ncbi:MAG: SpoIIE family protein phosphatase [Myxococcota bacterium]|nr:SpoIIE family protein phosphatase [Myxococcota bacterium]
MSKGISKLFDFFRTHPKKKAHEAAFMAFLNAQSRALHRPIALLGMVCWLGFAFDTDPKLHPEFPDLLYFRLGLTVVCGIAFILTFFKKLRGKGQGLLYLMGGYIAISCGYFTGRVADDASYVAGVQIVALLSVLMPLNRRALNLLLSSVFVPFIIAVVIYKPDLSSPAAIYSMNNLIITFVLCFIIVFVNDRLRFAIFYDRLKLSDSNQELTKTKDALWGEMEIAKKIQTVLLPEKPAINGFEVSGSMMPADQVGGDYYDVINAGDMDWVVIGDVSGHGVPAGLIMMMVQTSIHTALRNNANMSPSDLMVLVNETIAANIEKLHEKKYMTITVIAYHKEGRFCFSGLHQDILIYRSASKKVEKIPTNGIWLGVTESIDGMVKDDTFSIDVNDVILLYTDGIIEANKVNGRSDHDLDLYGSKRLAGVLSRLGEKSTDHIITGVLDSLNDYKTDDDVTVLAMKRCE